MESPEQLIERFTAFVQAETWPDSRWVLKQHPVLLGKAALEVVRSWVASIDDDDEAAWAYGYHYALLVSCQAIGFEDTFDHMIPSSGPPGGVVAPPEFEDDLRRLADLDEAASGDPAVHGDRIAVMEGILRRLDKKARPAFRGAILVNLGQAYVQLPGEGVARNLENAAVCYTEAATLFTPKTAPPAYAMSQADLGLSYMELTAGDRVTNLERAIASFNQALRFYSSEYTPLDYAETKHDLGRAYAMLPTGDHVENLRRAISCFRDTLRILAREEAGATEVTLVQRNLALATAELDRVLRGAR
jgi:hypothetical protein